MFRIDSLTPSRELVAELKKMREEKRIEDLSNRIDILTELLIRIWNVNPVP